jgi:hypothetical protein
MRSGFYFFVLSFVLVFVFSAEGKDYYIGTGGDDSNPGTSPEKAWRTIEKVNSFRFEAGDHIFFEGGKRFEGSLRFDADESGSKANPVSVGSYGKGRATISSGKENGLYLYNCGGFIVRDLIFVGAGRTVEGDFSGIYLFTDLVGNKPEYVRINNVEVSGYREKGICIAGSRQSDSGFRDVSVSNADVHDNGNHGISSLGSQPPGDWVHKQIYIGNCKVYENAGISGKRGHSGNGIMLSSVDGAVIEYCEVYHNGWLSDDPNGGGPIGIWAWDSSRVVIQYCEAYNNKTGNKADGGGFDLDGGCVNCIMQYNYSHDNDGAGYGIYQYNGARPFKNNIIRYNISENDGQNNHHSGINLWSTSSSGGIQDTEIYNNTIYISETTRGSGIADLPDSETNHVHNTKVYNNIFVTVPGKKVVDIPNPSGEWSFKGNCYWSSGDGISISWDGETYTSLNAWRTATGQEKFGDADVGLKADPKLKNVGRGGTVGNAQLLSTLDAYRLEGSSPLIDAGIDVRAAGIEPGERDYYGTSVPAGGKFDIGAHEYVGAACSKVDAGLVGWWRFEEAEGTVAKNSGILGASCDGVLKDMGTSAWLDGWNGGSGLYFEKDISRVEIGALNLYSNTVTISAWIKREGEQGIHSAIVLCRDGSTTAGITFGSTGEENGWGVNHELSYNWEDANSVWGWHSGLIVPENKWVFVAVSVEPTKATLYLCQDGKLRMATNEANHGVEEFDGLTLIGKDSYHNYEGHKSFNGVIDDVRIYNRALSREEISHLAGVSKAYQPSAGGTKYYVSPGGDESNPGTSPVWAWKTTGKVNSVSFKAGDSILFKGGVAFDGGLEFASDDSGTKDNPVTVSSYGSGRAVISSGSSDGLYGHNCENFIVKDLVFVGSGWTDPDGGSGVCFFTDLGEGRKPEHIRIDNVETNGYRDKGIHIAGAGRSNSGFRDVRITNCDVHNIGDQGISSSGSKPPGDWPHKDIYVGHCRIYDNAGYSEPASRGHHGNGIVLSAVDGAVVEYCEAYNNGWLCDTQGGGPVGIWTYDSHDVVIQFCEAYNNKSTGGDGGGFDIDGGCVNCVMQYNYSHDNDGPGYLICQYSGAREFKGNICRYNISENDSIGSRRPLGVIHFWSAGTSGGIQDSYVYNNTLYLGPATRSPGIKADSGEIYNTHIYNNIIMTVPGKRVVSLSDTSGGWFFRNNCYWSSGGPLEIIWGDKTYTSLKSWRSATGQEKLDGSDVGFETDPKLVNPGGGGTIGDVRRLGSLEAYKLRPDSPAVDAGVDIRELLEVDVGERDYYGGEIPSVEKFDIGAHEVSKGGGITSPVGWWKFDEGGGSIAKNSGSFGSRCEGRLNNMDESNWICGRVGASALSFDGKEKDVEVGALNLNSNTVTITAWVRRDGGQDIYAGIVFSRDGDTIAGIGSGSTGEPDWKPNQELYYGWNDTEETWSWHSGLIIPEGKWVFVALVLEPAKATLYLGEEGEVRSATNEVANEIEEFNGVVRIGHDKKPGYPPRYFRGQIDDVRIYDRPLSEVEIKRLVVMCR